MAMKKLDPELEQNMSTLDQLIGRITQKQLMQVLAQCLPQGIKTLVGVDHRIIDVLNDEEKKLMNDTIETLAKTFDILYHNPKVLNILLSIPEDDREGE